MRLYLPIIILIALALRIDFLIAGNHVIDADEAIVGLMAKHIAEGRGFPIFYYGQHYMGSLEALCAAGLFYLFGPSAIALKAVPLIFSLALVILVYKLGYKLGGVRAGRIAALLCAIAPAPLVVWSAKARGGFIETLVIGAVAMLITSDWLQNRSGQLWKIFLLGVVLGLGWWVNNQILFFMGPIGLWILLSSGFSLLTPQLGALGLLGFFVGGAPFWIYNINNNFASFGMFGGATAEQILQHVRGLFAQALPIIFGAMRFWQEDQIFPGAVIISWLIYLIVLALVVIFSWKQKVLPGLFLFFLIFACIVFSFSSFGWLVQAPRYLLPLYVGLLPLAGFAVSRLYQVSRLGGSVLGALMLSFNLLSCYYGGRALPGEPVVFAEERVSRDHRELLEWLSINDISHIITNYWIGYRVAFETLEKTTFSVFGEPRTVRIPEYQSNLSDIPDSKIPYVLVPKESQVVRKALALIGYRFQERTLSGYSVIFDITREDPELQRLSPSDFQIEASEHSEQVTALIDQDIATRWGTGSPQRPGQRLRVKLSVAKKIYKIALDLAGFAHDYPRGLKVVALTERGESITVLSEDQYEDLKYLNKNRSTEEILFPEREVTEFVIEQRGQHPILDWSVAELEIFVRSGAQ